MLNLKCYIAVFLLLYNIILCEICSFMFGLTAKGIRNVKEYAALPHTAMPCHVERSRNIRPDFQYC